MDAEESQRDGDGGAVPMEVDAEAGGSQNDENSPPVVDLDLGLYVLSAAALGAGTPPPPPIRWALPRLQAPTVRVCIYKQQSPLQTETTECNFLQIGRVTSRSNRVSVSLYLEVKNMPLPLPMPRLRVWLVPHCFKRGHSRYLTFTLTWACPPQKAATPDATTSLDPSNQP